MTPRQCILVIGLVISPGKDWFRAITVDEGQRADAEKEADMQAPTNGNVVKDLLSLDDDDTPKASTAGPSSFAGDLLGGLGADSNGHATGPAASGSPAIDLLSLLDDSASAQQPAAAAPQQSALVHTFPKACGSCNSHSLLMSA